MDGDFGQGAGAVQDHPTAAIVGDVEFEARHGVPGKHRVEDFGDPDQQFGWWVTGLERVAAGYHLADPVEVLRERPTRRFDDRVIEPKWPRDRDAHRAHGDRCRW